MLKIMKLIASNNSQIIESIQNPFDKDKVKQIRIVIDRKPIFEHWKHFKATIEFINNNTSGEHHIEDDNFEMLLKRIELIVNNL